MSRPILLLLCLTFLPPLSGQQLTMAHRIDVRAARVVPAATYPTYPAYVQLMAELARRHPTRCVLEDWGTLPSGRRILTLRLSNAVHQRQGQPQVLLTATMHGDETAGYWLMLRLAEDLLRNNPHGLLDDLEIFINPLANPDGAFARGNHTLDGATRGNRLGVDLNRNYPDPDDGLHPDGFDYQEETEIFMRAADEHDFDLALNLHGGAELFNYPWDTYHHRHADTDWWRTVSRNFARTAQAASASRYFDDRHNGVTNGHDWYPVAGSRQDYMNYYHRTREATIEISNTKRYPAARLPTLYRYTRSAMLGFVAEARLGIHGTVRDATTGRALDASVKIPGHDSMRSSIRTDRRFGKFYRYLTPGTYRLEVAAPGYYTRTVMVTVKEGRATEVNVSLSPVIARK